mgnify:FL=1|tara:strand:- start:1123 stop:1293 length:171 start_codon:yes stop_codon:yes gene_type:complete
MITQKQAKKLAVSFQAYLESQLNGDEKGQRVWARMLKQSQEETGVELVRHIVYKAA